MNSGDGSGDSTISDQLPADTTATSRASSPRALRRPLVAAWDLGRTLNRLDFETQAAWLSSNVQYGEAVPAHWDYLILAAGELGVEARKGEQLRADLREQRDAWTSIVDGEWYSEASYDMRRNPCLENARVLLQTMPEVVRRCATAIEQAVSEDYLAVVYLGRHADAALHRARAMDRRVCNAMFDRANSVEWEPPDLLWFQELQQRCSQLNLTSAPLINPVRAEAIVSREWIEQLIEEVGAAVQDELAGYERIVAQQNRLMVVMEPPHVAHEDPPPPYVVFDGTHYPLRDRKSGAYLQALLAAQGDWLGASDIRRLYPEFEGGRPDRIRNRLPAPIRQLVETEPSKGSRIRLTRLA
ncbi:MAG TPA: hypothetical protein VHV55_28460 [Pirellulales bacterium]|jgi:hypothetical protein|nr:hypothetical protein [Pirellulales bacterium]